MRMILFILAMSAVNNIPRIAPYFTDKIAKLPRFVRKCMLLLPVASLGALIFPASLTDYGSSWYAGLMGVFSAFIVSRLFKSPLIVAIIVSIAVTALFLLF